MSGNAPIALFIYNRPEHLAQTLRSLCENPELSDSPVYVYGDGPKDPADRVRVEAARQVAQEMLGGRANYRFRSDNAGLAASVIQGVTEVTELHGQAIVIEDDLQLSAGFLRYMNETLRKYAACEDVYQVSGYMFTAPQVASRRSAVFLPIISTWGWATWKRAWTKFDPLAVGWEKLRKNRQLRRRFNFDGVYNYAAMLNRQMLGRGDSWGIRWYWSVFIRNGLVCYPPWSLVANQGMDGSGTHGRGALRGFSTVAAAGAPGEIVLPDRPAINAIDGEEVRRAVWRQNGGWLGYAVDRLAFVRKLLRLRGKHS